MQIGGETRPKPSFRRRRSRDACQKGSDKRATSDTGDGHRAHLSLTVSVHLDAATPHAIRLWFFPMNNKQQIYLSLLSLPRGSDARTHGTFPLTPRLRSWPFVPSAPTRSAKMNYGNWSANSLHYTYTDFSHIHCTYLNRYFHFSVINCYNTTARQVLRQQSVRH